MLFHSDANASPFPTFLLCFLQQCNIVDNFVVCLMYHKTFLLSLRQPGLSPFYYTPVKFKTNVHFVDSQMPVLLVVEILIYFLLATAVVNQFWISLSVLFISLSSLQSNVLDFRLGHRLLFIDCTCQIILTFSRQKKFICDNCSISFPTSHGLNIHFHQQHTYCTTTSRQRRLVTVDL